MDKKFLDEFKALHKKKTGEDLSDQEALESATKLLTLAKAVYRPIPKRWLDELNDREDSSK